MPDKTELSRIYGRFDGMTKRIFRRAMMLATRSRVVRCHHVLLAIGQAAARQTWKDRPELPTWAEAFLSVFGHWGTILAACLAQDKSGPLEAPMVNSPAVDRVLEVSAALSPRAIGPGDLLAATVLCWPDEARPCPANEPMTEKLLKLLGIDPNWRAAPRASDPQESEAAVPARAPSLEELEEMIGPAVTNDELIGMHVAIQSTSDPDQRQRLREKLAYLTRGG